MKNSLFENLSFLTHGKVYNPFQPSPQTFSARSFLNSTMSCDVTDRYSPALSQTSRGQRIKRERLGTRLVVDKKYVPADILAVLKQELVVLSAWDPIGSLACVVCGKDDHLAHL